jgi:hypothetical protein
MQRECSIQTLFTSAIVLVNGRAIFQRRETTKAVRRLSDENHGRAMRSFFAAYVTWDEGGDAGKTAVPESSRYSVAAARLRNGPSGIRIVEGGDSKEKPPFCFYPLFSF